MILYASLALAGTDQPCPCTRWRSFEETLAEHMAVAGQVGEVSVRNGMQRASVEVDTWLIGAEQPTPLAIWGDDPLGCRASFPREVAGQSAWVLFQNEGLTWGLPRCGVGAIPTPTGEELDRLQRRLDLYGLMREGELGWAFDRYAQDRGAERSLSDMAGRDDEVGRAFWQLLVARRAVRPADAERVATELARTASFEELHELVVELARPEFTDHAQAVVVVMAIEKQGAPEAETLLSSLAWETRLHGDIRMRAFEAVASPTEHRQLERVLVTRDSVLMPQVLAWLEQAPQPELLDAFLASAMGWTAQHEAIVHRYAALDPEGLQRAARHVADGRRSVEGQLLSLAAGQVLAAEGEVGRAMELLQASLDSRYDDPEVRLQATWELGVLASRSGRSEVAKAAFEHLERQGKAPLCPPGDLPGSCRAPLAAHDAARPYALDQRSGFHLEYHPGGAQGCSLVLHPRIESGPDRKWLLQSPLPSSPRSTLSFELIRSDGSTVAVDEEVHRTLPKLWMPEHVIDFEPTVFETGCEDLDQPLLVRASMSMRGPSEEWGTLVLERWVASDP